MSESISAFQAFPQLLGTWLTEHAQAVWWYTALVRFLFPILALLVLVRAIRGLLRVPHTPEQWGQLSLPGGGSLPIDHWENILGRSSSADIRLNFSTVSRQHAALLRDESGSWWVTDLGSKGGTQVNGVQVSQRTPIRVGDTLTVGGVDLLFLPLSREEGEQLSRRRQEEAPLPMWPSLLWLTLFQLLAALQLAVSAGASVSPSLFLLFPGLPTVMWTYYLALRRCGARGFEMETIAFFLSTLSLAVTASSAPGSVLKQFIAILLGLTALVVLGVWLRDTSRTQRLRWLMAAAAIALLSVTLVLGQTRFGAANWIILGPLSFQPSEVAKIFYIFAGSATLERLFHRRNLGLFMVLTGVCLLCLALMSDFGTALIFFATFLVIAYLRSGDFATLSLICGGALFAGLLVLNFKPYIFRRFASWGHAWEFASTTGYQQTRAMSAAASGGLVGVGAGEGWLHTVPAADTDLVFGMLCEEWGLLIALLAVVSIVTLALFLFRFFSDGGHWASSPFNRHLYNSAGQLISGTLLDRDGEVLSAVDQSGSRTYPDGETRRKSILHVVGDPYGSIGTGALTAFADRLTGFDLLNGAFGAQRGNQVYLTIDADLNETAYRALNGRKGTVAVYNYQTGEILCLVSSPSFDPRNIPSGLETDPSYDGVYLNRFLSSTFPPGSIFKTVTLAAALEELPGLEERTWVCEGSAQIGDGTVTCTAAHGEQDIREALANSCNVVFGQLAVELGGSTLERYAGKAGLTSRYSVNGIPTAAGSFSLTGISDNDLAWAGVGQYHDAVNPCSMLVYMGAIANGGRAAVPCLLLQVDTPGLPDLPQFTRRTGRLIARDTAETLADMMAYNVTAAYGTSRFPNMDLCAKSGTAEVGGGQAPHAWFTGFLRDEDHPYAFLVLVENGGSGSSAAGDVASRVLNALVSP